MQDRQTYTVEDLLAEVTRMNEAVQSAAHIPVKVGDYVMRVANLGPHQLVLFGELLDPMALYTTPVEDMNPEQQAAYEAEKAAGEFARSRGYYYGRWFSVLCPQGEFGSPHASTFTMTVSQDVFEAARKAGWQVHFHDASVGDA